MTDISQLAVRLDTSDLVRGEKVIERIQKKSVTLVDVFEKLGVSAKSANFESFARNAGGASDALERTTREAKNAGAGMGTATAAVGGFGKKLLGIAAVMGGGLGIVEAIGTVRDFEASMNDVQEKLNLTGEGMLKVRDYALEMGRETAFSAAQVGEGLSTLASRGKSAEEAMRMLPDVLNLAVSSTLSLDRSSAIVANTMNQFGLGMEETTRVVDLLAGSADAGAANVEFLATVFTKAGSPARRLGVSMEDLAAAAGVMANAGEDASVTGTAFRNMFDQLLNPSERTKEALKDVGLSFEQFVKIGEDGKRQFIGIGEAFDLLKNSSADVPDLMKIFGREISALIPAILEGSEGLDAMAQKTEESASAMQQAKTQAQGLPGALTRISSAYKGLIIALADLGATGMLVGALEAVTRAMNYIATDGIAYLQPKLEAMGRVFGTFAGLVGPVAPYLLEFGAALFAVSKLATAAAAIGAAARGITLTSIAMSGLAGATALLTSPIVLISLFAVAVFEIYKNWDGLREWWSGLWGDFEGVVSVALGAVLTAIAGAGIGAALSAAVGVGTFGSLFAGFLTAIAPVTLAVGGLAAAAFLVYDNWESISAGWSRLWSDMKMSASDTIEDVQTIWANSAFEDKELDIDATIIEEIIRLATQFKVWWQNLDIPALIMEIEFPTWDGIKSTMGDILRGAKEAGAEFAENWGEGAKDSAEPKRAAEQMLTETVVFIRENPITKQAIEVGKEFPRGVAIGIHGSVDDVVDATRDMSTDIIDTAEKTLEVQSPSRIGIRIGGFFAEGVAVGIEQGGGDVVKAARVLSEGIIKSFDDMSDDISDAVGDQSLAFDRLLTSTEGYADAIELVDKNSYAYLSTLEEMDDRQRSIVEYIEDLNDELALQAVYMQGGEEAVRRYNLEAMGMVDVDIEGAIAKENLRDAQQEQIDAMKEAERMIGEQNKAMLLHNIAMTEGANAARSMALQLDDWGAAAADAYVANANLMALQIQQREELERLVTGFSDVLIDSIANGDSIREIFSNLRDYLRNWLKQMIAEFATNQILVSVGLGPDGGGLLGLLGGLFGSGGDSSNAGGIDAGVNAGLSGAVVGAAPGIGGVPGLTVQSFVAMAAASYKLGESFGDLTGAANSTAMAWGAVLGGPLGMVLGSLFGGDWETTGSGFNFNRTNGETSGEEWETRERERSLWRGTEVERLSKELDAAVIKAIDEFFDSLANHMEGQFNWLGSQALGFVFTELDALTSSTGIGVATMSGDRGAQMSMQRYVEWVMEDAFNNLESPDFETPEELQAFLESVGVDAYERITGGFSQGMQDYIHEVIDFDNASLEEVSAVFDDIAVAASILVPSVKAAGVALSHDLQAATVEMMRFADEVGGMETAMALWSNYFDKILNDQQRAEAAMAPARQALDLWNESLGRSGASAIDTRAELMAYVNAQDMSTEAGRRAVAAALQMVDAIAMIEDSAIAARERMVAVTDGLAILGISFDPLGPLAQSTADALIAAAGGMDAFQAGVNALFNAMYTESERSQISLGMAALGLQDVSQASEALGLGSINTREDLQRVVAALDMTNPAHRALYNLLMLMAPALEQVFDSGMSATEILEGMPDTLRDVAETSYAASEGGKAMANSNLELIDNLAVVGDAFRATSDETKMSVTDLAASGADSSTVMAKAADVFLQSAMILGRAMGLTDEEMLALARSSEAAGSSVAGADEAIAGFATTSVNAATAVGVLGDSLLVSSSAFANLSQSSINLTSGLNLASGSTQALFASVGGLGVAANDTSNVLNNTSNATTTLATSLISSTAATNGLSASLTSSGSTAIVSAGSVTAYTATLANSGSTAAANVAPVNGYSAAVANSGATATANVAPVNGYTAALTNSGNVATATVGPVNGYTSAVTLSGNAATTSNGQLLTLSRAITDSGSTATVNVGRLNSYSEAIRGSGTAAGGSLGSIRSLRDSISAVTGAAGRYGVLYTFGRALGDLANKASGALRIANSAAGQATQYAEQARSNTGSVTFLGSYATGTDYVPETGPYILHKGERVLTVAENRALEASAQSGTRTTSLGSSNKELRTELTAIRQELVQLRQQQSRETQATLGTLGQIAESSEEQVSSLNKVDRAQRLGSRRTA